MAVAAYVRLQHPNLDRTAASLLASLSPAENKVKAIVYADLATAAVHARDFEQANTLVAQSLDTVRRTETTLAKQRLQALTRRLPKAADKNIRELRERLAAIT
jgi:hypothetical protein